jgi:hypothetical protein
MTSVLTSMPALDPGTEYSGWQFCVVRGNDKIGRSDGLEAPTIGGDTLLHGDEHIDRTTLEWTVADDLIPGDASLGVGI